MAYNTNTIIKITGLTQRQVDYWDRTHFIKPSIKEASGYGTARLYSFKDLVQLKVAKTLIDKGVKNITSWPVGNPDGTRSEFTPSRWGLFKIGRWLHNNAKLCHGHVWGGGVFDYNGNILRLTDYVTKHDPKKDFVRQLVVFQDGTVAYSWIKEGALCMK